MGGERVVGGVEPRHLVLQAVRQARELTWEQAADYLMAKSDQSDHRDPERGRKAGMSQFLDDKSYRPGLGAYRRD